METASEAELFFSPPPHRLSFLASFSDHFLQAGAVCLLHKPLPRPRPRPLLLLCPPPNVATLGERGRADDFRGHPGVGAGGAHLGGAVPLAREAKVCDLQSLVAQVFHLNPLED